MNVDMFNSECVNIFTVNVFVRLSSWMCMYVCKRANIHIMNVHVASTIVNVRVKRARECEEWVGGDEGVGGRRLERRNVRL